ncbi:hypothetical protein F6V30_00825 [Oryzomonas sagensis]|uniref:Uncharacterized protein n=1 Tax=Oryzomonas sagensis TaxID=2603857 RepID=A0ABQ6TQ77_9BACT|nr:hypothetical protein [Oryzomonas sagensis]KAB0671168.1 hypothetical protein F6V30_00825 [Oryzomonas sagensis]
MKRNIVMGIAIALGVLSTGVVGASAATTTSCCNEGVCFDKSSARQYQQETAPLSDAVRAKEMELSQLLGYDSTITEVRQLEAEIKDLKDRIAAVAKKYDIQDCCRG